MAETITLRSLPWEVEEAPTQAAELLIILLPETRPYDLTRPRRCRRSIMMGRHVRHGGTRDER